MAGLAFFVIGWVAVALLFAERIWSPADVAREASLATSATEANGPEATAGTDGAVRVIDGLDNVQNSIHALGAVWAVTSNRPDSFSRDPLDADVVRIDPTTGSADEVLASLVIEPTFSELDGMLWIALPDRVVALDAAGSVVASVPFAASPGDQVAGETHLWVLDIARDQVSAIDPGTGSIVRTIGTGDFSFRPLSAFGHVWIPSVVEGTVTIVDEATLGDTTMVSPFVSLDQLSDLTPVPSGGSGGEVWVTTVEGELFALSALRPQDEPVRKIGVDVPINRIAVHEDRAFLLPVAGHDVIVLDVGTDEILARIPTDAIPYRALAAHDLIWIVGEGSKEILTVIDPQSLSVQATFSIGSGESPTSGPHRPIAVGDEVWIPNRGDDAFYIVEVDDL